MLNIEIHLYYHMLLNNLHSYRTMCNVDAQKDLDDAQSM